MTDQKIPLIDRLIGLVSPRIAAERFAYREMLLSYRGGVSTRLNTPYTGSMSKTGTRTPSLYQQRQMRDRARNLDRNNALASSVLDRAVENVVGTGIKIEPRTDSDDFNAEVKKKWNIWCSTCDIRRTFDFNQLQQLAFRSELRDGDVGVLLVDRGGEPRLQAIEGDYIESPPGKYQAGTTVDGVELDSVGAPVAYYIRTVDEKYKETFTRVAANNFIFLAGVDRLSDVRGASRFAQGFELFDFISGYLEGTVTAARAASYFSLMIKKNNAAKAFGGLGTTTNASGNTQRTLKLEPGSIQYLQPDEDITQISPQQPTQNFPDAIAAFARFVGLKFGLTIEQVLLDFSRTNYSSSRAARLQAQQTADMEQAVFANRFVSRVYQWVVSKWVKQRMIAAPAPEDFWAHEWIPQGRPWVDPTKEIDAARMAIELGIETRSNLAMERGYDFKQLCEQNERDNECLAEHGLSTATQSPPQTNPQPPQEPQDEQDQPETEPADTDGNGDGNTTQPDGE